MRVHSQLGPAEAGKSRGACTSSGGRQGPRGPAAAELTSSFPPRPGPRECVGGRSGEGALELGGTALAAGSGGDPGGRESLAPSSSLSKLSPSGPEPRRLVLPTSCVLGQYCDFHRAARLGRPGPAPPKVTGLGGDRGTERSLTAWKMTQDLKAAGGAAESNLTSTIPTPSTKKEPPAQEPQHVRTGLVPYQGLCAPPIEMEGSTEDRRGLGLPKVTEEFVVDGRPKAHLLTSNPDLTPSPTLPAQVGLLIILSSAFMTHFLHRREDKTGSGQGTLLLASPGMRDHEENAVGATHTLVIMETSWLEGPALRTGDLWFHFSQVSLSHHRLSTD